MILILLYAGVDLSSWVWGMDFVVSVFLICFVISHPSASLPFGVGRIHMCVTPVVSHIYCCSTCPCFIGILLPINVQIKHTYFASTVDVGTINNLLGWLLFWCLYQLPLWVWSHNFISSKATIWSFDQLPMWYIWSDSLSWWYNIQF